jgi:glycosyltransferase involved in cell wall biosynthesis
MRRAVAVTDTNTKSSAPLTLTFVIASYNRAQFLPGLLSALEKQTLARDRFDVVLVDDGSREPIRPVLEQRGTELRLKLIEQSNTGQATARHRGIEQATGDIILIVDDDMVLAPDLAEAHLRWHERGFRVVLGRIQSASSIDHMPLFERFHARQLEKMVEAFRNGNEPHGVHFCTGNVSFRREDYLAIGGFDRSLKRSEDRDLGLRLEHAGASFAYAEDAGTVHESDHTDLGVWLKRAYNYGIYDLRIHHKHPEIELANPWRFLFLVSPVSRPALLLTTVVPRFGTALAPKLMGFADWLDKKGHTTHALRATTLVYGLQYFSGMREEAGPISQSLRDLALAFRQRRKARRAPSAAE